MDQCYKKEIGKTEPSGMKMIKISFPTPIRSSSIENLKYKCNNFFRGNYFIYKNFSWYVLSVFFFQTLSSNYHEYC